MEQDVIFFEVRRWINFAQEDYIEEAKGVSTLASNYISRIISTSKENTPHCEKKYCNSCWDDDTNPSIPFWQNTYTYRNMIEP